MIHLIQLKKINGTSISEMPNEGEGESIFSMPDNLLDSMDINMDDFDISLESED